MPCADGQFGRRGLVAAHDRNGEIPRSGASFRRLRQHPRLALRHDGTASYESANRHTVLPGFPALHDPRHRAGAHPAGRRPRHRTHRRAGRKFGGRISGRRMGRHGAAAHRQTGADRHLGQGVAVEHRHRRDTAHGHRSRPDVRRAARRRGNGRSCGGPRHRPADLQGIAGLQPHAAGPRGASGRAPRIELPAVSGREALQTLQRLLLLRHSQRIRHPRRRTRTRRGSGRPESDRGPHDRRRHYDRHHLHPDRDA